MKKESIIGVLSIILFTLLISLAVYYGNNRCYFDNSTNFNDKKTTVPKETSIRTDTIIQIPSFLKNTIYIYNGDEYGYNKPMLIDSTYTPPQKYYLNKITIKKQNNYVTISSDYERKTYKILKEEYYLKGNPISIRNQVNKLRGLELPGKLLETKFAILHIDNGYVILIEDVYTNKKQYDCRIVSGYYTLGTPMRIYGHLLNELDFHY